MENNAPSSLSPREDWLHGEVDAFDSHEQVRSGLRKSDCCGPRVKRVVTRSDDKAEKDAVKLNEERGVVPSVEEGLDVDRLCGSTSRTRCQLVKLAEEFHGGDASSYP